jgi:hypothetical protein
LTKIGIIIDKYHLENKVSDFLKYLKTIAEVSIYLEESYLVNSSKIKFDEDIFFVKGKGDLILALVKNIEKETSIPVINSSRGIWYTMNRFMTSVVLQKEGILVPDFSLNPLSDSPPFEDFIVKNIVDQKHYSFIGKIEKINGHLRIFDERALKEAQGGKENYQYFYFQKYIKSKWEYKIYGIGDQVFFYKQLPVLVNKNKMESRVEIEANSELKEIVLKAMRVLDLKITSVDFLRSKESKFYLTDINSIPNFNYIKDGVKIVGNYLLEQAKR